MTINSLPSTPAALPAGPAAPASPAQAPGQQAAPAAPAPAAEAAPEIDIQDILSLQGPGPSQPPPVQSLSEKVMTRISQIEPIQRLRGQVTLKIGEQRIAVDPQKISTEQLTRILTEALSKLPAQADMNWVQSLKAVSGKVLKSPEPAPDKLELQSLRAADKARDKAFTKLAASLVKTEQALEGRYAAAVAKALKLKDPAARQQALSQAVAEFRAGFGQHEAKVRARFAEIQQDYAGQLGSGGDASRKLIDASQASFNAWGDTYFGQFQRYLDVVSTRDSELAAAQDLPAGESGKAADTIRARANQAIQGVGEAMRSGTRAAVDRHAKLHKATVSPHKLLQTADQAREKDLSAARKAVQTSFKQAFGDFATAVKAGGKLETPAARRAAIDQATRRFESTMSSLATSHRQQLAQVQSRYAATIGLLGPQGARLSEASQASIAGLAASVETSMQQYLGIWKQGLVAADAVADLPPAERKTAQAAIDKQSDAATRALNERVDADEQAATRLYEQARLAQTDPKAFLEAASQTRGDALAGARKQLGKGFAKALESFQQASREALAMAAPAARQSALDKAQAQYQSAMQTAFTAYRTQLDQVQSRYAQQLSPLGGIAAEKLSTASQASLTALAQGIETHLQRYVELSLQGNRDANARLALPPAEQDKARAEARRHVLKVSAELNASQNQAYEAAFAIFDRAQALQTSPPAQVIAGADKARQKQVDGITLRLQDGFRQANQTYGSAVAAAARLPDPAARRAAIEQARLAFASSLKAEFTRYRDETSLAQSQFAASLNAWGGADAGHLIAASERSLKGIADLLEQHLGHYVEIRNQSNLETDAAAALPEAQRGKALSAARHKADRAIETVNKSFAQEQEKILADYEALVKASLQPERA